VAARVVHFCVGWGPWPSELFLERLEEHCALRKLRCLICRDDNVRRVVRALQAGRIRIRFHLDVQADYEDPTDPYAQLGYAAKDDGAFVVNDPDAAKAAQNKAVVHYHFLRAGVPVPQTVVVRNWEPGKFKLTPQERKRLGRPFIIKPARGFGKQGVAKVARGSIREIARARRYDRGDDFLLQEFVEPAWFGHRMGWFRVFYLLGEVILCWWDTVTEHYACVGLDEFQAHRLFPLPQIAHTIARCTGMNYFSTEMAAVGNGPRRRFLAIDYVNDPCDMTAQSHSHTGVPDVVVEHVAERLVEAAWQVARGQQPDQAFRVWFAG